jgi:dolichol-phosphate mannosyltransferase
MKTGSVIPCYGGGQTTLGLINRLVPIVDLIVIVDDCCPLNTGNLVLEHYNSSAIHVIFNKKNLGVGASTIKGFLWLIDEGCEIVIKIDADDQMNPSLIPELIKPIAMGTSEACKGNRFTCIDHIISMPKIRIIGNLGLSFLTKMSTGYWELFDPTNGFIAFKTEALQRVRLNKVDTRFFFESDLLFQCSLAGISFAQLSMASVYKDEVSSLKPFQEIANFGFKHFTNFLKRLVYQYFLLDFNIGSLELIIGFVGTIICAYASIYVLLKGVLLHHYATPGESTLIGITAILSTQTILGFFYFDATQQPLMRQLRKYQ